MTKEETAVDDVADRPENTDEAARKPRKKVKLAVEPPSEDTGAKDAAAAESPKEKPAAKPKRADDGDTRDNDGGAEPNDDRGNQNDGGNGGDDNGGNRGRNNRRGGDQNQGGGRRRRGRRNRDQQPEPIPEFDGPPLNISELKSKTASELIEEAEAMGIENVSRAKKQDVIFQMIRTRAKMGQQIFGDGVLEILSDGFGFLRAPEASYQAGPDDIYVSPSQIRRFSLRTGDSITGQIRTPKDNERYFALLKVDTINGETPEQSKRKVPFENLTPLFPEEQLVMEVGNGSTEDITARIVDIVSPFGKGQRGLIVSPPKAGKTMLMQNLAQSVAANYPDAYLIVLLIDERPEEVTDMQRSVRGEVVSSTFDEPAARHVQVAEMVIEKAKRLVEHKMDVIILLDSITRLARAYNTVAPSSGKVLTGGVDANALQKPKRFFGAARNVEEGGSLTIIATALVETGSKMDEVIYEEFKGTGNMEIQMERRIAEKRVFPAINITRSGTRREELMMDAVTLQKVWVLRKLLHSMDEIAAVELLIDRMKQTKTNAEFFDSMKRQ